MCRAEPAHTVRSCAFLTASVWINIQYVTQSFSNKVEWNELFYRRLFTRIRRTNLNKWMHASSIPVCSGEWHMPIPLINSR